MQRRGAERPGLADWVALAAAAILALLLLLSGEPTRVRAASTLRGTLFYPLRWLLAYPPTTPQAQREVLRLTGELAACRLARAGLEEARRENARLRGLLGFASPDSLTLIPARVVDRTADRFGEVLTLLPSGGGAARRGQPVVAGEGLAGSVIAVDGATCQVRTLRNGALAVSARLQEHRTPGVLRWRPEDRRLAFEGLPLPGRVGVGERLLTSGYGQLFPAGLPVGTVETVRDDSLALVKEVRVRPLVDLDRADVLFLLGDGR